MLMLAMLVHCAAAQPLLGQNGGEPDVIPNPVNEDAGREGQVADIRNAINENLVSPISDDKAAAEPTSEEAAVPEQVAEEEERWYQQFQSATEAVQKLPDLLPVLHGRG